MSLLLDKTTLYELTSAKNRPFIKVDPNESIENVLQILKEKRIRAIPVIDDTNKCLGVVNVLDIVGYVASSGYQLADFQPQILSNPISQVLAFFKTEALLPMFDTFPLKLAINALCGLTHCIPVTNQQGEIIDLITQSDVNSFIYTHGVRDFIGDKAGIALESQGFVLGRENVTRVDKNATVSSVLPLLYEKKQSSVAIVDSQGKFLGNFSASELRNISKENFQSIYDPISTFVDIAYQNVAVVVPSTGLGTVVQTLHEKKLHRVWIVDEERYPVGLVTLSDIMREIAPTALRASVQ